LANNDANATISWVNFSTTDLFPKLPPDEPSQEYDETVIVGQEYFDFSNKIVDTGFSTQAGSGPALTNFNSTPWMAFLENPAQAPWIPSFPENQRRQPPVIMVSSLNGSTWSTPQPLWDPGLSGLDLFVNGYQGPAAITAPALAASASEIMAVWVENAVDGSDALAVFAEGTLASPPASPTIFFAKYANGAWTQRKPVKGALTRATPALVRRVDRPAAILLSQSQDLCQSAQKGQRSRRNMVAPKPRGERS
jgi:hypothetical protein